MQRILALTADLPPGGGAFVLPRLTLGVFQSDQPRHRFALGSDRRKGVPLLQRQGWILPAGAEGLCEFDDGLRLTTLAFDAESLRELDLDARDPELRRLGPLDPLLVQMALAAEGFAAGPRLYRDAMEQALTSHLAQILHPAPAAAARIDDRRLRRALAWIEAHLAEDIAVDDLAREAAMSAFHFSRAFKDATGVSPLQYVIQARMERAQLLLRTTRQSVAEIAFAVGYTDSSRFGQHFRRAAGTTPAAFRAR